MDSEQMNEQDELVPAFGHTPQGQPILVSKRELEEVNQKVTVQKLEEAHQASSVIALYSQKAVKPDELAVLKRKMYNLVRQKLDRGWVEDVLDGKKKVDTNQMKMFALLVDRVLPKAHHTDNQNNKVQKNLSDLSIEELEAIALEKKKSEAVDAIVKEHGEDIEKELHELTQDTENQLIEHVAKVEKRDALANHGRAAAKKLQGSSKKAKQSVDTGKTELQ